MVGYTDTTLRNVKMTLQKRANKLTSLDVRGMLEGGKPFAAVLQPEPGQPRRLRAESLGCRPALQARRLLSQRRRRPDEPRGQSRRQGAGGADRHAVGARLPRAGRSRSSARCCRTPTAAVQAGRAPYRRARAVRVRDHARALLGRPRPVRDARRRRSTACSSARTCAARSTSAAQALEIGGTYVPMSGLMRVAGRDPAVRAAADRSARRGYVRHHLRHPGLDGAGRR